MYFCVEFEVGVNDSIFSGNGQQKVFCDLRNYAIINTKNDRKNVRLINRYSNVWTLDR